MPAPRALRNLTDATGLVLAAATAGLAIAAMCVAGAWERIMSAYFGAYIAAMAWGCFCVVYYISSCAPM